MIDSIFAKQVIERFRIIPDMNIQICDHRGIVISSNAFSDIGTFDCDSYKAIVEEHAVERVLVKIGSSEYNIYKNCIPLFYKEKIFGAVTLFAKNQELIKTSPAIAIAIESMFQLEALQSNTAHKTNPYTQFINKLIGEEFSTEAELLELSKNLGFDSSHVRTPILINIPDMNFSLDQIIHEFELNTMYNSQDIFMLTKDKNIVIFKSFGKNIQKIVPTFRILIFEYINSLNHIDFISSAPCKYYVGSLQQNLNLYKCSYLHLMWLLTLVHKDNKKLYFFNDYIYEYVQSRVEQTEYHQVFSIYKQLFTDEELDMFVETVTSLFENNMNLAKSASSLYIHRNTLMLRLNKIKDMLSIDPVNDGKNREFLYQLLYYCKNFTL